MYELYAIRTLCEELQIVTQMPRLSKTSSHTLLHVEKTDSPSVSSNTVMKIRANALLMTCYVKVKSPEGSVITARALLDSASSASFVTERLARAYLVLAHFWSYWHHHSVASFSIITTSPPGETIDVVAIVSPIVTCDLTSIARLV